MSNRALWQVLAAACLSLAPVPAAAALSTPPATAPRLPAAAIRADFIDLYRRLRAAHFDLYARVSRAAYDRLYARELAAIRGPETALAVARRFQRFVAFGHVAHARIDFAYRAWADFLGSGGRAFPLTLRVVDGRARVIADRSGLNRLAAGDEVSALDGRPMRDWLARARRNLSADNEYMANALLELDLPMLLWLETGPRTAFRLTVRHGRARPFTIVMPARTRAEMSAAAHGEPPRLDLATRDRSWRLLAPAIAYLRPGAFYNAEAPQRPYDNTAFRRFVDNAFQEILLTGATDVLIDLRDNPGGDSAFSDLLLGWFADRPWQFASAFRIRASSEAIESNRRRLAGPGGDPSGMSARFAALYAAATPGSIVDFPVPPARPREGARFTGRVHLLINRNSYSNAVAVAATVQDYHFGTIIGEETSDLATTYGAMETFTLPRTGLVVGFPKARIVRPSGNLAARGVIPDLAIPTPLHESPDDPVLGQALALLTSQR